MNGAKSAPSSPPTDSAPSAEPAKLSPGMAALLRRETESPKGTKGADENHAAEPGKAAPKSGHGLLKASLVLADLLLALLAACLALRKGSFGFLEIALCVLALALGAWLACLAIWFGKDGDKTDL